MRIHRIFTNQPLTPGREVVLEESATRHLVQVLHLKSGMQLMLFNGDGHDYSALLLLASKHSVRAEIKDVSAEEPVSPLAIHLGIGVSKGERMDFALQKAVELGVSEVTPLFTKRSVVHLKGERLAKRLNHWRNVIISACELSGRRRVPLLHDLRLLDAWEPDLGGNRGFLLDHRASTTLTELPPPTGSVCLLVGPEGGLSEEESNLATVKGFQRVRLGPRIMRTETAPLAAIAAIQVLWGDFR